jgi:hypothetical protein
MGQGQGIIPTYVANAVQAMQYAAIPDNVSAFQSALNSSMAEGSLITDSGVPLVIPPLMVTGVIDQATWDIASELLVALTGQQLLWPVQTTYADNPSATVGDFFGDVTSFVSHAAAAVTSPHTLVGNILGTVGHVLGPVADIAKSIASNAIGAISLIPGIGTGVAAALSAGLAILEGGSPLDIAIKTAYGAIPIPPGVKQFTDIVLDAVLHLIGGGNVETAAIATLKDETVGKLPDFAKDMAGQVFDTLAHLFVQATTGKPTHATTSKPMTKAAVKAVQAAHTAGKALPAHVTPVPALSPAHHLALHITPAIKAQVAALAPAAGLPPGHPAAPGAPPAAAEHVQAAHSPGAPGGATFWHCQPLPGGHWQCQWQ